MGSPRDRDGGTVGREAAQEVRATAHGVETSPATRWRLATKLTTPLGVTLIVCAVWFAWAVGEVRREPVEGLVKVGEQFLEQGRGESAAIDRSHVAAVGRYGYDGQFFYFVALDPTRATAYIDAPSYRYGRIVYPLAARALALGKPTAIPWAMFLLNLAAVAGGTLALGVLLRRRGASATYAMLFGFAPGLFVAVSRDLSEPLAYALVLVGLLAWWWDDRPRPWLCGLIFGLAGVTRETTLLFPAALALAAVLGLSDGGKRRRDLRTGLIVGVTAFVPYIVLRLALLAWLGSDTAGPPNSRFPLLPFGGVLAHWPLNRVLIDQVSGVVLPALVGFVLVWWFTRRIGPSLLALGLNVAVLVVFLPAASYDEISASSRIALGVTCAFLASLPVVPQAQRAEVALGVAILALAPWYDLLPSAFGR